MTDLIDMLAEEIEGHEFTDSGICEHHIHMTPQFMCWKASVNRWLRENLPKNEGRTTEQLAQQMMNHIESGSTLIVKWVFLAEGMDSEGHRACYMDAGSDQGAWEELGLLEFAKTRVIARMNGDD